MVEEYNKDEIISEAPEYSIKSEYSKASLVFKASETCRDLRSTEMSKGFYNYKLNKEGEIIARVWNPDSRKSFIASVEALRILLTPEISRNENIKKRIILLKEKEKKLLEDYSITEEEETFIPEIGFKKFITRSVSRGDNSTKPNRNESIEQVGYYDLKTNNYWNKRVYISDNLFETLNILIDALNYFKAGASF